ncbi:MAG: formylglycine-generating enzyme family protein [Candidatus Moduliflexus flocculans]|nr:formylglycine-generating enzyme family protein [Candidatus Moduliflexus flocculans]
MGEPSPDRPSATCRKGTSPIGTSRPSCWRSTGRSALDHRLPTEAEWEKCCRGGSPSPQYGPIDEISWNVENSGGKAHPVGTKRPNGFGLFDMLGNVWEWCSDWYAGGYYGTSPLLNPTGPSRGQRRVCRGGGFLHGGGYLRSAHRNSQEPAKSKPFAWLSSRLGLTRLTVRVSKAMTPRL